MVVDTLKGLVRSMTGTSLRSKHSEVKITETGNSNDKMNAIILVNHDEILNKLHRKTLQTELSAV